ncbi:DUF3139 domain-containing protein [Paenibacillus chitinolyticus]|uniref:DUF3139 domain-containing protein n=1 Tax=Paenibacillus chitinolyticus TaxID=79263 RepID=UPI003646FA00
MSKGMKVFLVAFLVLILGVSAAIKITFVKKEVAVKNYLINEMKYKDNEIRSARGVVGSLPTFAVKVVFSDEPEVEYFYKEESGKVIQLPKTGLGDENLKHNEKNKKQNPRA